MKLVHITFHFEFAEAVEEILDEAGVPNYVRYPMVEGKDAEGKHYGTKVYPGSTTVVQAFADEETADALLEALGEFREAEPAHRHLAAVVVPVEKSLF